MNGKLQLGFNFILPTGPEEIGVRAGLVGNDEESLYQKAANYLVEYDRAIRQGKCFCGWHEGKDLFDHEEHPEYIAEEVRFLTSRLDAVSIELNGGTNMGMAVDNGGQVRLIENLQSIFRHKGLMWGLPAEFTLKVRNVEYHITYGGAFGYGFSGHHLDITQVSPFEPITLSETGFRSFLSAFEWLPPIAGETVRKWVARFLRDHLDRKKGK